MAIASLKKIVTYDDGLLVCADNLEYMRSLPNNSVDMVLGSPPYEDRRTYRELNFNLKGQAWVDWMAERWVEMNRICTGLVCMVLDGITEDFVYSGTPFLLGADLIRKHGILLRKPPLYERNGVFGSGGPDYLRNDYEFVLTSCKGGRLPFSDNKAMGSPPVCKPGGAPTHRGKDGERVEGKEYKPPEIANPGNVIHCGAVGGGNMGSDIAHEGDAPYPEYLAEFLIRTFCREGGTVLDPFVGTGTTVSVARQHRRRFVGIDLRESEIEKSERRLYEAVTRRSLLI